MLFVSCELFVSYVSVCVSVMCVWLYGMSVVCVCVWSVCTHFLHTNKSVDIAARRVQSDHFDNI